MAFLKRDHVELLLGLGVLALGLGLLVFTFSHALAIAAAPGDFFRSQFPQNQSHTARRHPSAGTRPTSMPRSRTPRGRATRPSPPYNGISAMGYESLDRLPARTDTQTRVSIR